MSAEDAAGDGHAGAGLAHAPVAQQGGSPGGIMPFPPVEGAPFGAALALSVTNAQTEVAKKISSEHITREIELRHEREMKKLALDEQALADDESERIREHERDQRDRDERQADYRRVATIALVGMIVVLALARPGRRSRQVDRGEVRLDPWWCRRD